MDTAPGDDSAQSDPEAGPSLPPPPCPGEGGGAAESCWAQGEPEHRSIRIDCDSVLFGKRTENKGEPEALRTLNSVLVCTLGR